jgi:hypothetical protein
MSVNRYYEGFGVRAAPIVTLMSVKTSLRAILAFVREHGISPFFRDEVF